MRVLSIVALVFFVIVLVAMLASGAKAPQAAAGFGMIGIFFGIGYAVVGVVAANRAKTRERRSALAELDQLYELRGKGALPEEEFAARKERILKRN